MNAKENTIRWEEYFQLDDRNYSVRDYVLLIICKQVIGNWKIFFHQGTVLNEKEEF